MGVLANAQQMLRSKKEFWQAAKKGDLLFPCLEMGEHQRQKQSQYEWGWWYSSIYMNKLDAIEFLTLKYPAKDHSEEISQAIRYKRSAILSLLLANTTHFDAKQAIDLFTNSEYPSTLAQIWIPYLTQEEIDWALVLSATKKSSEIVKVLAPLCSMAVCEHAILEALVSEHDCGECIEILRPFVGESALYGVYREFARKQTRSTEETLAILPMIDVNRWNGVVTHNAYTCDIVKLLYSHCNPYQTQGLLSIKHDSKMACQWTKVIVEDEQNADPHRMEQLRQMKRDAQPTLDFVQAVKEGNVSYIASAAVDEDTVNGAFVMSMLWGNDSPKHLLARGIWDESMWGALLEAIDHKSPHLLWLIDQYDYIQCPKRKIYAKIVAEKLLNKRLFGVYTQMTPMFSNLNTIQLALWQAYSKSAKAVQTVFQNTPPSFEILRHVFDKGYYHWMAYLVSAYPQVNYFSFLQQVVEKGPLVSQALQHKRDKILKLLCSHHLKHHPEDLEKILHFSIGKNCVSIVSFLLPQTDEAQRAQLFVTAASTTCFFDNLFSTTYSTEIYTKAMLQAVFYGRNICMDKLWEHADVEEVHTEIYHNGYTNSLMLYFYQRLDEQHTREQQRQLLIEAVGQPPRTDVPEVGRRI